MVTAARAPVSSPRACVRSALPVGADAVQPIDVDVVASRYAIGATDARPAGGFSTLQEKGARDRARKTALVIGAGPAGLMASTELAHRGFEVIAADKRLQHGRLGILNLRPLAIDLLARHGALEGLGCALAPLESLVEVNEVGRVRERETPQHVPDPAAPCLRRPISLEEVTQRPAVASVATRDLEVALEAVAVSRGVRVVRGATVALRAAEGTRRFGATLHEAARGASIDLGFPDLVVVADGAASDARGRLGIETDAESEAQTYIAGVVAGAEASKTWRFSGPDRDGATLNDFVQGHRPLATSWLLVQIPAARADDKDAASAHFAARAKEILGVPAYLPLDVKWGGTGRFAVQHRRARAVTAGSNVLIAGDAASCGSPATGLGVNKAMVCDGTSIGAVADGLCRGEPRRALLDAYAARSRANAETLFARGAPTFAVNAADE